ncbi:hypothetical protein L914_16117 [Phytophthora nicotianae]|uniref:Uncharacterized protein n=1 Tax=Phytophthora nicotianae TaxID=4792 RepID=W2MLW9_PHYNI|nr:hypothetical protein L914_16117 [Phytophthora nicotianae]
MQRSICCDRTLGLVSSWNPQRRPRWRVQDEHGALGSPFFAKTKMLPRDVSVDCRDLAWIDSWRLTDNRLKGSQVDSLNFLECFTIHRGWIRCFFQSRRPPSRAACLELKHFFSKDALLLVLFLSRFPMVSLTHKCAMSEQSPSALKTTP